MILKKRWNQLLNELTTKCISNSLQNVIIAGDFNKNISEESHLIEELDKYNLKIVSPDCDYTYKSGKNTSKIDFYIVSKELYDYGHIDTENSLSDHRIVTFSLDKSFEFAKNQVIIPNREVACHSTYFALADCHFSLKNFCEEHTLQLNSLGDHWKTIKPKHEYKQKLQKMFQSKNFGNNLVKKELEINWNQLWKDIQKERYSSLPKDAFNKI